MKPQQDVHPQQQELETRLAELRRSQQDVECARDRYAFLYEFAPVGYLTFDGNSCIRSVNLTGARQLGLEAKQILECNFDDFVADEDRFVFRNFLRKIFDNRRKETCRLRLANGHQQAQYVRIEGMVTEAGDECLAVLIDITEKKRAEQALSESEYNLAKAQAMTHVGSWSFDPDTGEVNASDELLRIMRLSREETTQEDFASVVHPSDMTKVLEQLRLGVEHGKSYEIEHRLQFSDGSSKWVYTIVEPAVNSAGKVLKLYGTTQDITPRKQAEVALANKTNELQTIFDSIGDGITVYDQEGGVQHHNLISPQFFPGKMQSGHACREIFHPDSPSPTPDCAVERALQGERVDTSLVLAREGEKTRYLDITATPIKDALGGKNRALVFFRDVSEKRMQEMHLIQTEKMSSIGVLSTGIAHEINNPLTSVAGFAEALLRRFRDEPVLKTDPRLDVFPHYLEVIVRESYRCKGIIDNLLSFGRKSDGLPVKVDLNRVLQEILELLRYQASFQKTQVLTRFKPDLPRVLGDPSGLRQVCMNLLVNAHQAIEGAGLVEVETDQRDDSRVTIIIRDSGCGMSKEVQDRIWEPFFTTKEVGKGVGLGLALTYSIVKRHGGEIELESRVDEGSIFKVQLPICLE